MFSDAFHLFCICIRTLFCVRISCNCFVKSIGDIVYLLCGYAQWQWTYLKICYMWLSGLEQIWHSRSLLIFWTRHWVLFVGFYNNRCMYFQSFIPLLNFLIFLLNLNIYHFIYDSNALYMWITTGTLVSLPVLRHFAAYHWSLSKILGALEFGAMLGWGGRTCFQLAIIGSWYNIIN